MDTEDYRYLLGCSDEWVVEKCSGSWHSRWGGLGSQYWEIEAEVEAQVSETQVDPQRYSVW